MLRFIFRTAMSFPTSLCTLSTTLAPSEIAITPTQNIACSSKTSYANYATIGKKRRATMLRKKKIKVEVDPNTLPLSVEERTRLLSEDKNNEAINVGHNGRPLFTTAPSLGKITKDDACTFMKFNLGKLEKDLPEGLPSGMLYEFKASLGNALMIRESFLELRDNFRRIADPLMQNGYTGRKAQKHVLLDGLIGCGKTIALAMLALWARSEGWLVFYVPNARDWTDGGFRYKNAQTNLWDTPCKATEILKRFAVYNGSRLKGLPCHIHDPFPLGEGCGIGFRKDADSIEMPEGSTLSNLIERGLSSTHAAVGALVRLRKELSHVKDVPMIIIIDNYNSWFSWSKYEEVVNIHTCRRVHSREVATVNVFRPMMNDDMMVGATTYSMNIGKLRRYLPDVPFDARVLMPRYSLDEAAAISHYYLRQKMVRPQYFYEESWKKVFYLSNGNGKEIRSLLPLIR